MIEILLFFLLGGILLYLGVVGYVYGKQRSLQYFPSHVDVKGEGNQDFEAWRSDSGEFWGYWRPVEKPARVVVFFHGNAGEALDRNWLAEVVPANQLLILAEYPGYGARPGTPTEKNLFDAAEKILDQVAKRWKAPVTVVGESLGSGVAVYLASRKPIDRLGLISPFASALEIARHAYPLLPVKFLMKDCYLSVDFARSAKAPLHVVHGTLDDVIPLEAAQELVQVYGGTQKVFSEVPGYGHNNMAEAVVDSPFADKFRDFIAKP